MAKTVTWNKTATIKLDEIFDYLNKEISEQTAARFLNQVFDKLDILAQHPEIGRKSSKKKTVRHYKIDKHRHLYYRVHGNRLIVVYIFDSRQHPDKNPY